VWFLVVFICRLGSCEVADQKTWFTNAFACNEARTTLIDWRGRKFKDIEWNEAVCVYDTRDPRIVDPKDLGRLTGWPKTRR